MTTPDLEFIRQQHESFLNDLEGLAVQALASGDCFESQKDYQEALAFISRLLGEASTKSLTGSGADLLPKTQANES